MATINFLRISLLKSSDLNLSETAKPGFVVSHVKNTESVLNVTQRQTCTQKTSRSETLKAVLGTPNVSVILPGYKIYVQHLKLEL